MRKYICCFLCVFTILLQFLARTVDGFAQWYGECIYPIFVQTIGRICSFFPFSVVEFLLYGLILYIVGSLCKRISFKKILSDVVVIALSLLLLYTLTCGINYFRNPFSEVSGITIGKHNEEELRELCEYLVEEINRTSRQLERDEEGIALCDANLHQEAQKAMQNLSEKYPVLGGYYPNPKPIFISEILTYQYIMGIYSPFTLEANYNADMIPYELPYSICHELSHLKGFMREDEAGFIAYLACHYSDSVFFQYSGAMEAFSYAIGSYYNVAGYKKYKEVLEQLEQEVIAEIQVKNDWWEQYNTVVQEVSSQVNDAYLKVNDQEDGIQSYGRMVDLLLEEYISQKER